MTNEDLQAALDAATATLAARELRCWEDEYSPEPEQYAAAHARAVAQLRDPAGPLAPLLAVLAQTERERDEARALAALVTTYREACAAIEIADSKALRLFDAPKREREQAEAARLVALRAHLTALAALRETPAGEGEQ